MFKKIKSYNQNIIKKIFKAQGIYNFSHLEIHKYT